MFKIVSDFKSLQFVKCLLRQSRAAYICLEKDPKLNTAGNVLRAFCHRDLWRIKALPLCHARDSLVVASGRLKSSRSVFSTTFYKLTTNLSKHIQAALIADIFHLLKLPQ